MNIADIRGLSVNQLVKLADCASPDSMTSPGAAFLESVRDAVADTIEPDGTLRDDSRHEIADGAPDVYTVTRWAEFVDLAAYQEEPDCGEWPSDLTDAAGVALYQIAARLISAILDDIDTDETEDDDSEADAEGEPA